jgi:hypothetical protein
MRYLPQVFKLVILTHLQRNKVSAVRMVLRKRDNAIAPNMQEKEPAPSENPSSYFRHHLQIVHKRESSRNGVIGMVTRLQAGPSGVRILAGVRNLSLLSKVQTGSGAYTSSDAMINETFSLELKR